MIKYVLGFAFTPEVGLYRRVALIEKKKPKWQEGRINGIGGKIEPGETAVQAMSREFYEETSVFLGVEHWRHAGRLIGNDWASEVFTVVHPHVALVRTNEFEQVRLDNVFITRSQLNPCIENVLALIDLCLIPASAPSNTIPVFTLDYRTCER